MDTKEFIRRGDRSELGGELKKWFNRYWIKRNWVNAALGRRKWQTVSNIDLDQYLSHKATKVELSQLDALIDWKLDDYVKRRNTAKAKQENGIMQDQITIELRVDFADKDKIPELTKIACSMARTLVANVQLLGPTCKPECVVFTDNFMSAPQQVDIYADLIGKGKDELSAIEAKDAVFSGAATATVTGEDQVSDELLAALRS